MFLYIKSKENVLVPGDNKRHRSKRKNTSWNILYGFIFKDFSCQIKRYDHIKVEEINLESFLPLVVEKLRHAEKSPFDDDIVYKHTLEECPICLENKNDFNQTICNHLFCTDCFGGIQNHRCPLCRNSL